MAHWWELWSPGLQAFGGVVELAAAGLLAYEWWKGISETQNFNFTSTLLRMHRLKSDEDPIFQDDPDGSRYKNAKEIVQASVDEFETIRNQRKLYKLGFFTVVEGVILRIVANGIAWFGAYGLIS